MEPISSVCALVYGATLWLYAYKTGYTDNQYILYRRAYKIYQKEIIKNGLSYKFYLTVFREGNKYIKSRGHNTLNEYNRNFCTVNYFLRNHKEVISTYFSRNKFSFEDFKKMKLELYASSRLPKEKVVGTIDEFKEKNQSEIPGTLITETAAVTENKNPFEHNFKDWQFDILKECINEVQIFKSSVSVEETKAIFDCKSQNNLRSRNNCVLAHFFQQLAKYGYITINWQSVIANNRLLKAPQKNDFLNAGDLSSANEKVIKALPEKIIKEYIKQLQKD